MSSKKINKFVKKCIDKGYKPVYNSVIALRILLMFNSIFGINVRP